MPVNGRNKGHSYERKIAKELRAFYQDVKTSRYANKLLDDLKVDLVGTGDFYIQCKAVEKGIKPHDILASMPQEDKINLLFHKRNRKGEVVSLNKEDFYKLLTAYEHYKTKVNRRSRAKTNKRKPKRRR